MTNVQANCNRIEPGRLRGIYQKLYDTERLHYGDAEHDRCPGVRYFKFYKSWLEGKVIDLGCGRGQAVMMMRKLGFEADGVDFVTCNPEMLVGDIAHEMYLGEYQSVTCCDVLEHLPIDSVHRVMLNARSTRKQVWTVCNSSAKEVGFKEELHITRLSERDWLKLISNYYKVFQVTQLAPTRFLFLTQSK